jgi:hypothetical protein
MSDVELNETINGYRGSIGKLVFKKYRGRTIICRKGVITKPPTAAQLASRADFREASEFAKSIKVNPALLAFYEPIAKQREVTVRVVAMGDYLKKPTLKPLNFSNYKGQVGDVIEIRAEDDLGLAELHVKIVAKDGTSIESGLAVEENERSGKWLYTATAPVPRGNEVFIEVKGLDHAGNMAQLSESTTLRENQ